jgi:hypothetical protein
MLHKLRRLWPRADRMLEITSAAAQLLAQLAARLAKVRQALDEYGGPLLPDHDDVWIFDARHRNDKPNRNRQLLYLKNPFTPGGIYVHIPNHR